MIITKKTLPRRTFLRGVGASLALPLLDSMVPAFAAARTSAAKPIQRLFTGYVPNGMTRKGCFVAPGCILMPSFLNIGCYVDSGTMVDTWSTVGSGAQVGKNCHLSGGVGIGGVLEPVQAGPTIIEDGCFIGARSEIVESVIVRKNSVISMGVFIGASTKIIYRDTGKVIMGEVPEGSVVVPGTLPSKKPGMPSLYCAVIIKTVDEKTRSKTSLNDLLRD